MSRAGGDVGAAWRQVDPRAATELIDARLQLHHAAQLAAAIGISYLPRQADDSHTNLEWIHTVDALASRPAKGSSATIRLAVRPNLFSLLLLDDANEPLATFRLNGRTLSGATRWVRARLAEHGLDPAAYTLDKHYTIPHHAVAEATPFNSTNVSRFEELASWFANASLALEKLAASMPHASEVRCWPHHFDIATLIELAPGKTIGVGMEPGDQYYREPYFYVNASPRPAADLPRPRLGGEGIWHTREWLGAVLPASRVVASANGQQSQVDEFTGSAVHACMGLLMKK
jgi:hypothetical protein